MYLIDNFSLKSICFLDNFVQHWSSHLRCSGEQVNGWEFWGELSTAGSFKMGLRGALVQKARPLLCVRRAKSSWLVGGGSLKPGTVAWGGRSGLGWAGRSELGWAGGSELGWAGGKSDGVNWECWLFCNAKSLLGVANLFPCNWATHCWLKENHLVTNVRELKSWSQD